MEGYGYAFCYDEDKGYVLTEGSRGHINLSIESADELDFRFLFQKHIVHHFSEISEHTISELPAMKQFMAKAREIFGETKEYRRAEEELERICVHQKDESAVRSSGMKKYGAGNLEKLSDSRKEDVKELTNYEMNKNSCR